MKIFVAQLNFKTKKHTLREAFEDYGEVTDCRIVMDKQTERSKGFGFIEMPNDEHAKQAILNLNDAELDGRPIVVKKSQPKS